MKKKLTIIIAVVVVAAAVIVSLSWKKAETIPVVMQKDAVTGQSIYTNTEYGFSVAYSDAWDGPAERLAAKPEDKSSALNAIFLSPATSEAVVIQGKAGDTESMNDLAALLGSPSKVVTVGGQPALRYEYVGPINEEAALYAKTVMFAVKGLKAGSVTIGYQQIAPTEAKAKAADLTKLNEFVSHITFK